MGNERGHINHMTKKLSAIIILCMVVGFGFGGCLGFATTRGEKMEHNGILILLNECHDAAEKSAVSMKECGDVRDVCLEVNRIYEKRFVKEYLGE